jgi:hypothetical protein
VPDLISTGPEIKSTGPEIKSTGPDLVSTGPEIILEKNISTMSLPSHRTNLTEFPQTDWKSIFFQAYQKVGICQKLLG